MILNNKLFKKVPQLCSSSLRASPHWLRSSANVTYARNVTRNSKNIFLTKKRIIGFQGEINLIFSKTKEGDNIMFSPLCSENDLHIKENFI